MPVRSTRRISGDWPVTPNRWSGSWSAACTVTTTDTRKHSTKGTRAEALGIPSVEVDFSPFFPGVDQPEDRRLLEPIGRVSSLQVPHRIADAILRDSLHHDVAFRDSEIGTRLDRASVRDATVLFEYC